MNSRRQVLLGTLGVVAGGGFAAWSKRNSILGWAARLNRNAALQLTPAPTLDGQAAVLTPEQVEGPFFVSAPHRRNVKEDRRGKDLHLRMQVVRIPGGAPVEGGIVEMWHCDADGAYSGYPAEVAHDLWKTLALIGLQAEHVDPMNEERFLRGAQITDANGMVEFETIFPGWYEPRPPHIHFKVIAHDRLYLTSQFYFEPSFCNRIYLHQSPYSSHGACPYTAENDTAIKQYQDAKGLLLEPVWSDTAPLLASARIGITGWRNPGG